MSANMSIEEAIQHMQHIRDDLQSKIDAVDISLRTMRAVLADMTPSGVYDQQTSAAPQQRKTTRRRKSTTLDMSTVPDYNPGRGGIRLDE